MIEIKMLENDGREWYVLNGIDDGTGILFEHETYGLTQDGAILDCDGYPVTVGDTTEIAVRRAIESLQDEEEEYMALVVKDMDDGVIGVGRTIHEARDDADQNNADMFDSDQSHQDYNVYRAVTDWTRADSGDIVECRCTKEVFEKAKKGLGFRNVIFDKDAMILKLK